MEGPRTIEPDELIFAMTQRGVTPTQLIVNLERLDLGAVLVLMEESARTVRAAYSQQVMEHLQGGPRRIEVPAGPTIGKGARRG